MGNSDCESTTLDTSDHFEKTLELIGIGYNRSYNADYYINLAKFLNNPSHYLEMMLLEATESSPETNVI